MLDIKFIRDNSDAVKKAIKDKNIDCDLDDLIALDKERRTLIQEIESLKSIKNDLNDMIKGASGDEERSEIITKGKDVKSKLEVKEPQYRNIMERYMSLMVRVPTVPAEDVPVGASEDENVTVYERGTNPTFAFTPRSHVELAKKLDIIDFKKGAEVSGYRGYYLKGAGAELLMALMQFALSKMSAKGFDLMVPPTLVKERALFGTGYFSGTTYNDEVDEVYQIASSSAESDGKKAKEKKFLVGTAEPSLLAYYSDLILDHTDLPVRICGFSQCYRSEIGSHGKDTTGLYRVHEFMKVEQVVLAAADTGASEKIQEEMVSISEEVLSDLGLPYRKLAICTGDMSAGKYRMFDLEAWMPGLDRWGEMGSASNFLDWQARRLNARYRDADGEVKHVYMLNNTVLPSPRSIVAILENYQNEDGSVTIPDVLQPFMVAGTKKIEVK